METKFTIYLGLNDKDTKQQMISTEEAMLKVHALVGDCSMSLIQGYFTHADGSMVIEKTIKCEIFGMEDNKVHAIVEQLKLDLCRKLDCMLELVKKVEERSPQVVQEYRQRLMDKVKELLEDTSIDESRILTEVTIFSDKIDEIARLRIYVA